MSEKSKGDTYPTSTSSPRIVKNPLLSASVTGLTFDDFPNKPQLLPAAPPLALIKTKVDPKLLVTVGNPEDVDTENLDEINLNSTSDDSQPAVIDTNENPIAELNSSNADSILSQAATSFSALPSVASTVFSTFSKRIYSGSSSRERTPTIDSSAQDINANSGSYQAGISPYYQYQPQQHQAYQQEVQSGINPEVTPPPLYAAAAGSSALIQSVTPQFGSELSNQPPSEPPKFYSPAELPPIAPVAAPPTVGQNSYRLAAKKKLYAPIPGLSDESQKAISTVDPISGPLVVDRSQLQETQSTVSSYPFANQFVPSPQPPDSGFSQHGQEDKKASGGGLFSITNYVPTGVLQNLSGLVQSAAVTLTQGNKSELSAQAVPPQEQSSGIDGNYFNAPQHSHFQVATGTPPTSINFNQYTEQNIQPTRQSYQNQFPQSELIGGNLKHQSTPPNIEAVPSAASANPISYFGSQPLPTSQTLNPVTATVAQSGALPFVVNPGQQIATTETSAPTYNFFGASNTPLQTAIAQTSEQASYPAFVTPTQAGASGPPPAASSGPPPVVSSGPPPKGGPTSFRLQKGTRLYKSPLSPTETVPLNTDQSSLSQQILLPAHANFNPTPFATPVVSDYAATGNSNPNAAVAPILNYFTPQTSNQQSVPLFPHSTVENKPAESVQPISVDLFSPTLADVPQQPLPTIQSEFTPSAPEYPLQLHEDKETAQQIESFTTPSIFSNTIEPVIDKVEQPQSNIPSQSETSVPTDKPTATTTKTDITEKEEIADDLEKTLERLELETKQAINPPPRNLLPSLQSQTTIGADTTNPFRREVHTTESTTSGIGQGNLAYFFTPISTENTASECFNFFGAPQTETKPVSLVFPPTSSETAPVAPNQVVNFFNLPQSSGQEENKTIPILVAPEKPQESSIAQSTTFAYIPPPPPLVSEDVITSAAAQHTIAPPLGFDNILAETIAVSDQSVLNSDSSQPENNPTLESTVTENLSTNSFTNFFQKLSENSTEPIQEEQKSLPDPTSFFDTFIPQSQAQHTLPPTIKLADSTSSSIDTTQQPQPQLQQPLQTEDQRIQNFFNNPPPPPKESRGDSHDLNYDLIHSGLGIKNLQRRSLTPASNIVEPPSSSCSEFSELNISSAAAQRSLTENSSITKETISNNLTADSNDSTVAVDQSLEVKQKNYQDLPEEVLQELRMANILTDESETASIASSTIVYTPAVKHWFYKQSVGTKHVWTPFSHYDSAVLETSLAMGDDMPTLVAVEGGRYDVNIRERTKMPVYWEGAPIEVRRCSWFYKGTDSKYVPYTEPVADLLENEYKQATESGIWHQKIFLSMGEQVVFHGPTVIVHFQRLQNDDAWGGTSQTTTRPRVVKRDLNDFNIDQGESQRVDHLMFMVHGIGSACDLKLRPVEEVVDDFRSIAQQLVQSHYRNSTDMGIVGRVEVLPISWHSHLHSEEVGIDDKLRSITLESIPKLRNFTNDTLLDVLFYTSPKYCQQIMNTVAASMNSVYMLYRKRHPEFTGGVSLAGHSLGSLILFDLLCHQKPIKESEEQNMENPDQFLSSQASFNQDNNRMELSPNEVESQQVGYTMGPAGTGQPFIHYTQLVFQPKKFFALGSPIGMFVTIRGIDKLGLDFRLPTCSGFYNIFHPFDPVAYRIEALVNPDMSTIRPVLIAHHKGRKRMHLELKETMTRVGADLKQRFFDTFKSTLESVNFLSSKSKKEAEETMEKEVNKVLELQMQLEQQQQQREQEQRSQQQPDPTQPSTSTQVRSRANSTSTVQSDSDMVEVDFPLGKLNDSKRVDYVLQEAPLEFFNEYVFALSSHVCYWSSEDTILFVMKEIYSGLGISPDSQVPQQTMSIERPNSRTGILPMNSPTN